jgi:hypothetical protein
MESESKNVLSSFRFSEVYRNTFLVSRYASEPWTRAVDIQFSPDAERIPDFRRLNLDDFGAKLPLTSRQGQWSKNSRSKLTRAIGLQMDPL